MAAKSRKANWSATEITVLVDQCTENNNILTGKFSPVVSAADRTRFWCECGEKINSVGSNFRSIPEIIKKWTELKSATKKKERRRRDESIKTGGGQNSVSLTNVEDKILSVIPQCQIDGIAAGVDTFVEQSDKPEHEEVSEDLGKKNNPIQSNGEVCPPKPSNKKRKYAIDESCICSKKLINLQEEILKEQRDSRISFEGINKSLEGINASLKELVDLQRTSKLTELLY